MKFLCQIRLYPEVFGPLQGKMAYIFITDIEGAAVATWDADAGENAVIIQPGKPPAVATKPLATGPTLYEYIEIPTTGEVNTRLCEFAVEVFQRADPEFIDETNRAGLNDVEFEQYSKRCEGNKIGGTPMFLQEDKLPASGHLLLQLDSMQVPFAINFGDCGVGYAFISPDGTQGRFFWQCY